MTAAAAHPRLNPVERTLMTPELSNASPRARQGLIGMLQGAGDPVFVRVVEDARALLRELWRTQNADTFIVPGSEEAGLEAVLCNLVEPGDVVLAATNGLAGLRMAETARRLGARVETLDVPWGSPVPAAELRHALARARPALVTLSHGDGSTGVLEPLAELAALAREHDALTVADVCSTTAVVEVLVDDWGLDACWAGSQKGLSAYPGLALATFGARAAARHARRAAPVASWCFELDGLRAFDQEERRHQTYPAPLLYALLEMLQLASEQTMAYRVRRHHNRTAALVAGLEALGLEVVGAPEARLPSVTVVRVPAGLDERRIRAELREQFRIEIAGGVGEWSGAVWRIGIMSHSAQPGFIVALLAALEALLARAGHAVPAPGGAVAAAVAVLEP